MGEERRSWPRRRGSRGEGEEEGSPQAAPAQVVTGTCNHRFTGARRARVWDTQVILENNISFHWKFQTKCIWYLEVFENVCIVPQVGI